MRRRLHARGSVLGLTGAHRYDRIFADTNIMTSADHTELARILKVLSADVRVRIVQLLKGRSLCVNALAARLDVTQGAVSQHLRVMRDAGLVIDERSGYFVHYRLDEHTLARWRKQVDSLLTPAEGGRHQCVGRAATRSAGAPASSRPGKGKADVGG